MKSFPRTLVFLLLVATLLSCAKEKTMADITPSDFKRNSLDSAIFHDVLHWEDQGLVEAPFSWNKFVYEGILSRSTTATYDAGILKYTFFSHIKSRSDFITKCRKCKLIKLDSWDRAEAMTKIGSYKGWTTYSLDYSDGGHHLFALSNGVVYVCWRGNGM